MKPILTLFFTALFGLVYSQQKGQLFQLDSSGNYCAAVLTDSFKYHMAEQEHDNWCWAACIEMVLEYQGLNVSQTQIVKKAYGEIVNRPADCDMTTNTANGWRLGSEKIKAREVMHFDAKYVIDALAKKYPLIVGLNMPGQNIGHAYVLTAIYFHVDSKGKPVPDYVVLRDPWGPNPDKTSVNWFDFNRRINCMVYVTF
jgi:hypothetical protein